MKVLIVNEDDFVRTVLSKSLQSAGYEVVESGDGSSAIAKLKRGGFNLIITDNVLPKGSAKPVAEFIKNHSPLLPVLVISSGLAPSDRRDIVSSVLFANKILYQPFSKEMLLNALEETFSDFFAMQ